MRPAQRFQIYSWPVVKKGCSPLLQAVPNPRTSKTNLRAFSRATLSLSLSLFFFLLLFALCSRVSKRECKSQRAGCSRSASVGVERYVWWLTDTERKREREREREVVPAKSRQTFSVTARRERGKIAGTTSGNRAPSSPFVLPPPPSHKPCTFSAKPTRKNEGRKEHGGHVARETRGRTQRDPSPDPGNGNANT